MVHIWAEHGWDYDSEIGVCPAWTVYRAWGQGCLHTHMTHPQVWNAKLVAGIFSKACAAVHNAFRPDDGTPRPWGGVQL